MNRLLVSVAVLTALASVSGCSDSSPTVKSPSPSLTSGEPTKQAATEALSVWLDAVSAGDGPVACGRMTEEFTAKIVAESVAEGMVDDDANCQDSVEAAGVLIKEAGGFGDYTTEVVSFTEGEAGVRVTYPDEGGAETYLLAYTGGKWLVANDDPMETTGG